MSADSRQASLPRSPFAHCRGGRRADLGNGYFRSRMEANYARYLNLLLGQGQIAGWHYEPQTFVFAGITRGAIRYTPDFLVVETDGRRVFHEVKGWLDGPSKTRLKRMRAQYPQHEVRVIGRPEYTQIARFAGLIPGWEY